MAYDAEALPKGVQNLLKLADILDQVRENPNNSYDQSTFFRPQECGTAACALGWGGISEQLGYTRIGASLGWAVDGERLGWEAVAETIFELQGDEVGRLFGDHPGTAAFYGAKRTSDVTAEIAASKIREFALSKIGAK